MGKKGGSSACRTNLERRHKWQNLGREAARVMIAILTPERKFHEGRVFSVFTEAQFTEGCKEDEDFFFFSCDK